MVSEPIRLGRAQPFRDHIIDVARRLGAALCLAGVYFAAVQGFDVKWVAVAAAGALIVATGPQRWAPPEALSPTLPWPSWPVLWKNLFPGWALMMIAGPAKLLEMSPRLLIWVWFAGVCWLLVGAWRASHGERAPVRGATTGSDWVWVLIVLGVAFVLRAWSISTVPREVHGDETATAYRALAFYADPQRDWFGADILMNFLYALAGGGMLVFDVGLLGSRASDVVLGTLSTGLLFDALRRVSSRRVAIVGALLLATNHVHIAYSRNGASYIQAAFVVTALLAAAARVWTSPTYLNAVLLGAAAGMGLEMVPASVMTLPFFLVTMLLLTILRPAHSRRLVVALSIAAVTCASVEAPFVAGMWQNRKALMTRSNEISIFSPNKMERLKTEVYHTDSTPRVVAGQVWVGLTGFQFGQNAQPQYATQRPLADSYTAALLIVGTIFAILGLRQFIALSSLVFTAGYLVVGLGMYHAMGFQRAVGALPTGITLMAIGLVQCCETLCAGRIRVAGWARDLLLAAAVIGCGLVNLDIYFVQCRPTILFSDARSEAQWVAREFAHDYHVHLVDWDPPGKDDAPLITEHLPISWNANRDPVAYAKSEGVTGADLFVLHSDDTAARDVLLARFPGARVEERRRHPAYGATLILIFVEAPGARNNGTARADFDSPAWMHPFHALSVTLYRAAENYVQSEYAVGRPGR